MFFTPQVLTRIAKKQAQLQMLRNPQLKDEISNFNKNLNTNIQVIYHDIKNGAYPFDEIRTRKIPKSNGMHRTIYSSGFKDSIVLKALQIYLQAIINPLLTDSAIAFRKNMNGVKNAVKIAKRFSEGKYQNKILIKADIHDYFNCINTELLLQRLKPFINSEAFDLLNDLFQKYSFLPQGLAPMNVLANFYLNNYDQNLRGLGIYRRYADDFLLVIDKGDLKIVKEKIFNELNKLSLTINKEKFKVIDVGEEFEFLGYVFRDGDIKIRRKTVHKLYSKIKNILKKYNDLPNLQWVKEINDVLSIYSSKSWLRNFSYVNNVEQLKEIDKNIEVIIRKHFTGRWQGKSARVVNRRVLQQMSMKSLVNQYYRLKNVYKRDLNNIFTYFNKSFLENLLNSKSFKELTFEEKNDLINRLNKKKLQNIDWSNEFKVFVNKYGKEIVHTSNENKLYLKVFSQYIRNVLFIKQPKLVTIIKGAKNLYYDSDLNLLRFDIKSFQSSVNALNIIEHYLKNNIDDQVYNEIVKFFTLLEEKNISGIPRGLPLSNILAELLLQEIEKGLKKEFKVVLRYADDFLIGTKLSNSEKVLGKVQEILNVFDLELNKEKTTFISVNSDKALELLGYKFERNSIGINDFHFEKLKRKLRRRIRKARNLHSMIKNVNYLIGNQHYSSLFYYKYITNFEQLKQLDEFIYRQIRITYFDRNKDIDRRKLPIKQLRRLGLKSAVKEVGLMKKSIYQYSKAISK